MSEELDPALTMGHLKKGNINSKKSGFAGKESETINDELEPYIRKDESAKNVNSLSKFNTPLTNEDEDM